jgi:hypothetical protein
VSVDGGLILNPGFEAGTTDWKFSSNVSGNQFRVVSDAGYPCGQMGRVTINASGNNIQLFQTGLPIQKGQSYRLRFDGRADSTRNIGLFIHLHASPNTNLGLAVSKLELRNTWQSYDFTFTATDSTTNARLRLWFAGQSAGSQFWFDNLSLTALP